MWENPRSVCTNFQFRHSLLNFRRRTSLSVNSLVPPPNSSLMGLGTWSCSRPCKYLKMGVDNNNVINSMHAYFTLQVKFEYILYLNLNFSDHQLNIALPTRKQRLVYLEFGKTNQVVLMVWQGKTNWLGFKVYYHRKTTQSISRLESPCPEYPPDPRILNWDAIPTSIHQT